MNLFSPTERWNLVAEYARRERAGEGAAKYLGLTTLQLAAPTHLMYQPLLHVPAKNSNYVGVSVECFIRLEDPQARLATMIDNYMNRV